MHLCPQGSGLRWRPRDRISIHFHLAGRDESFEDYKVRICFSIHSPLAGRDSRNSQKPHAVFRPSLQKPFPSLGIQGEIQECACEKLAKKATKQVRTCRRFHVRFTFARSQDEFTLDLVGFLCANMHNLALIPVSKHIKSQAVAAGIYALFQLMPK